MLRGVLFCLLAVLAVINTNIPENRKRVLCLCYILFGCFVGNGEALCLLGRVIGGIKT